MTEPLLVILDLDETLIYAVDEKAGDEKPDRLPALYAGPYPAYIRPGLYAFLDQLVAEFRVAVWTSGSPAYANEVSWKIFGKSIKELQFIWASDRCTQKYDPEWREHYWAKNLAKVKRQGYDLERVVAVDNTPRKYAQHYGNLVRVKDFLGDESDNWLPELLEFLRWLNTKSNVRKVEKRGWKNSTAMRLL